MTELEQFKTEVIEKIKETDSSGLINSTCPQCYGSSGILNSHKCSEGWDYYFTFYQKGVPIDHIIKIMSLYKSITLKMSE